MAEKNIFVYKLLLSLNISDFSLVFLVQIATSSERKYKRKYKMYNIENVTLEKETTYICAGQILNFLLCKMVNLSS